MINRKIWVTFQREGIHCYPEALNKSELSDVSFLGHPHRHIFHFKITINVEHDNRDIEFIQFKRWLENLYSNNVLQLDYKSCEMIGEDLIGTIRTKYPKLKFISVDVSEDNENGAITTFTE